MKNNISPSLSCLISLYIFSLQVQEKPITSAFKEIVAGIIEHSIYKMANTFIKTDVMDTHGGTLEVWKKLMDRFQ